MSTYGFWYLVFALLLVFSALAVISFRNIIYAAFCLLLTFFSVAALYVFMRADFLAVTQIVVYVGGILILLLFGVMLTNKITSFFKIKTDIINIGWGSFVAGGILFLLASIIRTVSFGNLTWVKNAEKANNVLKDTDSTVQTIGTQLMTTNLLPLEIVSILLTVALLGAAYIARREPTKGRKTLSK
ncbi:MAG: NADH-quinone oxidoreductase subunit J [Bacteroidia bacterium]|nr:NADH-quinone oxidoreductase subunit J [Bacteroidia bacterium]MDW8301503.1 NADH-quinone oxidoreductase subunit J [Bacteroidia bacterium]